MFTYLVPTDKAWDKLKKDFATAYKVIEVKTTKRQLLHHTSTSLLFQILFMGDFYYQTHRILERHLKVGEKLSLKQLVDGSKDGRGIEVLRGSPLQLYSKEENGGKISKSEINKSNKTHISIV